MNDIQERVERWLASVEPEGMEMLADRLLIRTLMRGDTAELADRAAELLDGQWPLDTAVCVMAWCLQELGHDAAPRIMERLAADAESWNAQAERMQEPWRSAYTYWIRRCGLECSVAAGPWPKEPALQLYADFHTVFYAAHYGAAPISRTDPSVLVAAMYSPRMWMTRGASASADLVSEALLTELCLLPRREKIMEGMCNRLRGLQRADGSFTASPGASLTARHHAACVAALAFWML